MTRKYKQVLYNEQIMCKSKQIKVQIWFFSRSHQAGSLCFHELISELSDMKLAGKRKSVLINVNVLRRARFNLSLRSVTDNKIQTTAAQIRSLEEHLISQVFVKPCCLTDFTDSTHSLMNIYMITDTLVWPLKVMSVTWCLKHFTEMLYLFSVDTQSYA